MRIFVGVLSLLILQALSSCLLVDEWSEALSPTYVATGVAATAKIREFIKTITRVGWYIACYSVTRDCTVLCYRLVHINERCEMVEIVNYQFVWRHLLPHSPVDAWQDIVSW